jgi:hypothetical protein
VVPRRTAHLHVSPQAEPSQRGNRMTTAPGQTASPPRHTSGTHMHMGVYEHTMAQANEEFEPMAKRYPADGSPTCRSWCMHT